MTAARAPQPITATASPAGTLTMPAIVSATALPTSSAPSMLKTAARTIACPGRGAAGRDQRGDRVGGVVEPVGQREGDRERDGEPQFHEATTLGPCTSAAAPRSSPTSPATARRSASGPGPATRPPRNQSLAEATVAPGAATILHYHRASEELYLVTAGSGQLLIGEEEREVRGRRLRGDRARRTAPACATPAPSDLVVVCASSPAYSHEDTVLCEPGEG